MSNRSKSNIRRLKNRIQDITNNISRLYSRTFRRTSTSAIDTVDIDLTRVGNVSVDAIGATESTRVGNVTEMSNLEIRDQYEDWTREYAQRNLKWLEDGVAHEKYVMDEKIDVWHIATEMFIFPALRQLLNDTLPNRTFVNGVEIGCGTVTFFDHLNIENPILVDLAPDYCTFMASKGWKVLNENIENLSIDSDSQDIVVCSETLNVVLSLETALKEVERILTPDGIFLVNVPWEFELAEYDGMLGSHLREFNEHNVEEKFPRWDILARGIIPQTVKPNGIPTINLILARSDVSSSN